MTEPLTATRIAEHAETVKALDATPAELHTSALRRLDMSSHYADLPLPAASEGPAGPWTCGFCGGKNDDAFLYCPLCWNRRDFTEGVLQ
jgi:hypothetical protein